jgi:hypothetical protein
MGHWTLERVLSEHLATRTTYATTNGRPGDRRRALAAADVRRPHYDVVLKDATVEEVASFMSILSEPIRNPYCRKGR